MPKVTLPNKSIIEVEPGSPAVEIAKKISRSLAEDALAAKINGKVSDSIHRLPATANCSSSHSTIQKGEKCTGTAAPI